MQLAINGHIVFHSVILRLHWLFIEDWIYGGQDKKMMMMMMMMATRCSSRLSAPSRHTKPLSFPPNTIASLAMQSPLLNVTATCRKWNPRQAAAPLAKLLPRWTTRQVRLAGKVGKAAKSARPVQKKKIKKKKPKKDARPPRHEEIWRRHVA